MALPRFFAIKSSVNNKYLRYIHEDDSYNRGYLSFTGDEVATPYTKFEVDDGAVVGDGLVNIKCCYNNKYWRCPVNNYSYIVGWANQLQEDQSKPFCTLFKPVHVDGALNTFRISHIQTAYYLWPATGSALQAFAESFLIANPFGYQDVDPEGRDVFTIIDWESLFIMPKYVAFKGDNGKYLKAVHIDDYPHLQFSSDVEGEVETMNEVFTTSDGSVRIKSTSANKFWRRNSNWIWPDSHDTNGDDHDTLFWPVKVDYTSIALRNSGNNYYCERLTADARIDCLSAAAPSIATSTKLKVRELVFAREIYDFKYRLEDARIYGHKADWIIATASGSNGDEEPKTVDLKLSYSDTNTSIWKSIVSLKSRIKTTIRTGIPRILDEKITIKGKFDDEYKWGETMESAAQLEIVYSMMVPAMTRVTVKLTGIICSCDIPFSYVQRDTLTNGDYAINEMNDGIYSGTNYSNLNFVIEEEEI